MSEQIDRIDVGAGAADGQPHHNHQLVEDTAGLILGTDQLRTTMRERLLEYVQSKPSLAEWLLRLPELEEILYTKFPNKNDYYNMMKGPVEPQVQFAIMTLSAQNQHNQQNPQIAQMNQVPGTGVGVGGADRLPQHQPMQEMVAFSGTDQQFVMLRTAMREKIYEYIGRKQSSAEWRKRLPELAKRLEDVLYRKFPNKSDYYNMMKGPVEPQLQFAIKTLSAQIQHNQQNPQVERQTPPSSSSNLVSQKVKNPLHVSEGQIHKKLRCHFCKKKGHFNKDCVKRKKWFEKKGIPYDPTHKQT